jgi:hypothetical protein
MLQKNVPARGTEAEKTNGSEENEKAWVDSKSVCLDFKALSLFPPPNEVVTWTAVLKITPFNPAIKLCYKYGRYGHFSTRWHGKERNLTCGGDHATGKGQQCSINCRGGHTAFSKDCGKRTEEGKINRLMANKNMPAKEARKIVKTRFTCPLGLHILGPRKIPLSLPGGTLTLSRQKSRRLP